VAHRRRRAAKSGAGTADSGKAAWLNAGIRHGGKKPRKSVLFWKKEPKNFCKWGSASGRQRSPHSKSLFASFSSEKEEALHYAR
jgi:hypothetical protein